MAASGHRGDSVCSAVFADPPKRPLAQARDVKSYSDFGECSGGGGGSPWNTFTASKSPFSARLASITTAASSGRSSGLIFLSPLKNFVFLVRLKWRIWSL